MGLGKRIANIFKAKGNSALDNIENPVELLDQKIRDMEEGLNKAKLSSAGVLGNVHALEKSIQKAETESSDYDDKVKLALKKNNEELAKKALALKLESDNKLEKLNQQYKTAREEADKLKKGLLSLEEKIAKTRSYRDEAAARYENAKASVKVNEILSNVDAGGNSIKIDDIERKIQQKENKAEGLGDLQEDNSLDKEFEKLNEPDLDSELEKYKANLK